MQRHFESAWLRMPDELPDDLRMKIHQFVHEKGLPAWQVQPTEPGAGPSVHPAAGGSAGAERQSLRAGEHGGNVQMQTTKRT